MTSQVDPYSRIYWRIRDEFPDVYADKETFGWWTTLLMIADGAHPSAADLPRKVKASALAKLVDCELVTLLPGDRFRVRGVEKERDRRSDAGRKGGIASAKARTTVERSLNDRSPNAGTTAQPPFNLDETRQDETRKDETSREARPFVEAEPEWPLRQWLAQHGCYITEGNGFHRQLITGVERHGTAAILAMFEKLARAGVQDGDTKGFVFGALDALKPKPNLKLVDAEDREAAEREAQNRRVRQTREYIESMRRLD